MHSRKNKINCRKKVDEDIYLIFICVHEQTVSIWNYNLNFWQNALNYTNDWSQAFLVKINDLIAMHDALHVWIFEYFDDVCDSN